MSSPEPARLVSDPAAGLPRAVAAALAERRVLVVVPTYNEEESLSTTLRGVRRELPGARLVVISDCSTDRSAEVARAEGAEVVELPCNLGYGGAVQTGFKYALAHGFDFVVQMDADGQHDPGSAATLLDHVTRDEVDVAIGSRFLGQSNYHIPMLRRLGMAVFGWLVTFVTRRHFSDPTSGFQAMNTAVLRFLARDNYPSDFPDADTIILLVLAGFRVKEVPAVMQARTAGNSMHSNRKALYYVAKMMVSILMVLLRRSELRGQARPGKRAIEGDH
jgi:glycosyltransferase involved in cell wall biosynthesis